jgi:hypothetical protein
MKIIIFLISFFSSIQSHSIHADELCSALADASIVAKDGTFLGEFLNQYDAKSTLNEYGQYGGAYSANSIWNEYGQYGGKYSANSPFNPYSSEPPVILINGKFLAYLSVNENIPNSINPFMIKTCEF